MFLNMHTFYTFYIMLHVASILTWPGISHVGCLALSTVHLYYILRKIWHYVIFTSRLLQTPQRKGLLVTCCHFLMSTDKEMDEFCPACPDYLASDGLILLSPLTKDVTLHSTRCSHYLTDMEHYTWVSGCSCYGFYEFTSVYFSAGYHSTRGQGVNRALGVFCLFVYFNVTVTMMYVLNKITLCVPSMV